VVEESVKERLSTFLAAVQERGICVTRLILFGSHARGEASEWSDIDVVVVSPAFDSPDSRHLVNLLWDATVATKGRVEPIACGEKRWQEDDGSPVLEIARQEGIVLFPA
jgi:UTP:GlnB (protein PII) uridylyltransferase